MSKINIKQAELIHHFLMKLGRKLTALSMVACTVEATRQPQTDTKRKLN